MFVEAWVAIVVKAILSVGRRCSSTLGSTKLFRRLKHPPSVLSYPDLLYGFGLSPVVDASFFADSG